MKILGFYKGYKVIKSNPYKFYKQPTKFINVNSYSQRKRKLAYIIIELN